MMTSGWKKRGVFALASSVLAAAVLAAAVLASAVKVLFGPANCCRVALPAVAVSFWTAYRYRLLIMVVDNSIFIIANE